MRRFEFAAGTSSKFWQVDQQGSDLHVAWGRIGTAGQSQIKSFDSADVAASEAEKLIKKKVKEGYVEKDGTVDDVRPSAAPAAPREKPAKAKASAPKVDSKLLAAWRKAAKLVGDSGCSGLPEFTKKPGAWEAFAAGIESGDIPLAAIWRLGWVELGNVAMDHVPPKHTIGLLSAIPADMTDLWRTLYPRAIGAVLARLAAEPTELVAFADRAGSPIRELVEVARIQMGLLPAGQASAAIREAVPDQWTETLCLPDVSFVDGRVVRGPSDVGKLGDLLFGHEGLVAMLAEGYRKRLAAVAEGEGLSGDEDTVKIAAEGLTPEEVFRFVLRGGPFAAISKLWSLEDLERLALETKASTPTRASWLALLAIEREPSCAPRVESALVIKRAMALGLTKVYLALTRAPAEWLRRQVLEQVFAPGSDLSRQLGPFGIALLASVDTDVAESLALEHAELSYDALINYFDAKVVLSVAKRCAPTVKRGLAFPIIVDYRKHPAEAPEWLDALVEFDGSDRDSWQVPYVSNLPRERGLAILKRHVANGAAAHLRDAFTDEEELLAALFGEAPKAERESGDTLGAQAQEIERAASEIADKDRVTISLLAAGGDVGDAIGQVFGKARAVPKKMRPKFDGEPMVHVLTVDLDEMPEVRNELGKDKFRAVSLFVSDLDRHAAFGPGNPHTRVVWLEPKDVKAAVRASESDDDDDDDAEPGQRLRVRRVDLPKAAFDAEGPVTSILASSSYAGGMPVWIQGEDPEAKGRFVLQFDDELVPMNLADGGKMYAFEDTAFLQSS